MKKHVEFLIKEFADKIPKDSSFTTTNKPPFKDPAINLVKILSAEHKYKNELELLAIRTVKELFPVIKLANIRITADIEYNISHNDISLRGTPNFPKELDENISEDMLNKVIKQKYLNGIIQGAAIKMNRVQHMEKEKLDNINSNLVSLYDETLKANEFFSSSTSSLQLAHMAIEMNNNKRVMGTNKVTFENGVARITAKANNFVILVHEIVKGLYTYLTLNAYKSEDDYYNVTEYTDSIYSEIDEISVGKMLITELRDYIETNFAEKYTNHPAFFEMFIVKLSKVAPNDFVALIKGLNNGSPNKSKFESIVLDTYYEVKKLNY